MNKSIDILKGVNPGLFLKRELGKRKIKSGQFAKSIGEHPQTLSAIIRGHRSMNTALSLRIEQSLGLEEGLLMTLQVYYDIDCLKREQAASNKPNLSKYRATLFWDTAFDKIDWLAHRHFVINRIFSRGEEMEILETIRFYGKELIIEELDTASESPFATIIRNNLKQYLDYEA